MFRKLRMTFLSAPGPVGGGGGTHAICVSSPPTADSDLFDNARSSPTCNQRPQHRAIASHVLDTWHTAARTTSEQFPTTLSYTSRKRGNVGVAITL